MNRVFHARIVWYQYVYLVLLAGMAFYSLWTKHILVAAAVMVLLIILIEKIIHTTYTVTADGLLLVYNGRFARSITIKITDINEIEKRNSMKFGHFNITEYLLVRYNGNKYISLMPVREKEFLDLFSKLLN